MASLSTCRNAVRSSGWSAGRRSSVRLPQSVTVAQPRKHSLLWKHCWRRFYLRNGICQLRRFSLHVFVIAYVHSSCCVLTFLWFLKVMFLVFSSLHKDFWSGGSGTGEQKSSKCYSIRSNEWHTVCLFPISRSCNWMFHMWNILTTAATKDCRQLSNK